MKLTGGGGGGEMNKRSLEVMLELARAIAVANLRPQITVTDAAFAILLYDNTLFGRNGHSILQSSGSVRLFGRSLTRSVPPSNLQLAWYFSAMHPFAAVDLGFHSQNVFMP